YFLVYPEAVKDDARVAAFREWLIEEAAKTPT
ncbi:transcriptional regulator, partial [Mesorhizobium sp. M4B.F.Ca.ET.088.02.2.1]